MCLEQELRKKEKELAQIKSKLAEVEELEKQKRAIEDSLDQTKQQINAAKEQLSSVTEYAKEKLAIRHTLNNRIEQLLNQRNAYIAKIAGEIQEIENEVTDIDNGVGPQLFDAFKTLWELENPFIRTTNQVRTSQLNSYDYDIVGERARHERKFENNWKSYLNQLKSEVKEVKASV